MKLAALREATPAAKRNDVDHAIELFVEDGTFALDGSSAAFCSPRYGSVTPLHSAMPSRLMEGAWYMSV